jgi:hypothetical protein
VAFYDGCYYEVEPVIEGYCLYLVYNLVYSGSGSCPVPSPPQHEQEVSTIAALMKEWNEDESANCPSLMAYTLKKKYSAKMNLSFKSLKNKFDQAVAMVLASAQKKFSFDLYVASVCIDAKWLAIEEDEYDSFPGNSGYLEEVDHIGDYASATNLVSENGECIDSVDFDPNAISEYNFIGIGEKTPNKKVVTNSDQVTLFGTPMCNLTKKYYMMALLLWPRKNRLKNLGIVNMVHLLNKDLLEQCNASRTKKEVETRAKELVQKCVLPNHRDKMSDELYVSFLQSLQAFDKVELVSDFLQSIASSDVCHGSLIECSSFGKEIVSVGNKYDWDIVMSPLQAIFDEVPSSEGSRIEKCCQLLFNISQKSTSEAQRKVCRGLASSLVRVLLEQNERKLQPPDSPVLFLTRKEPIPFCPSKDFLLLLLQSLEEIGCEEQLDALIQDFTKKPANYSIACTLTPVCESLHKSLIEGEGNGNALKQLLFYCISALEKISHCTSWSKQYAFSCNCQSCQKLTNFLHDPKEEQHQFEVDETKRIHMLYQLQQYGCLSEVSTEYVESGHSLVVTKNYAKNGLSKLEQDTLSHLQSIRATSGLTTNTSSSFDDAKPLTKKCKVGQI